MRVTRSCAFLFAFVVFFLVLSSDRSDAQTDILPPVLVSVAVDNAEVTSGDILRFRFDATDETGIGRAHIIYETPSGSDLLLYTNRIDQYQVEYRIPENLPAGNYTLAQITLYDSSGIDNYAVHYRNGRVFSNTTTAPTAHNVDLSTADFIVRSGIETDFLPPVVSEVTVDDSRLSPGDLLRFRFVATDETGVDVVRAEYESPSGATISLPQIRNNSGVIEYRLSLIHI